MKKNLVFPGNTFDNRVETEYTVYTLDRQTGAPHNSSFQSYLPFPMDLAIKTARLKPYDTAAALQSREGSQVPILCLNLRVKSDATCACAMCGGAAVGKDAPGAFSSVIRFPIPISFGG